MPSNTQRIAAAIVTAGLFVGGAWVASGFGTDRGEAAASNSATANNNGLSVNLHGARSTKGNVVVMAFDQAAAFDNMDYTKAVGYFEVPASEQTMRFDFPDLKSGYYAVIALHDENCDYDLNYDAEYLPTEGYAVSGTNNLNGMPVFEYSLIEPGKASDLTLFYW